MLQAKYHFPSYLWVFFAVAFSTTVACSSSDRQSTGLLSGDQRIGRTDARVSAGSGHHGTQANHDSTPAAGSNQKNNVALASYQPGINGAPQWVESYDRAVEIAQQTGKPILADFTGSNWCGYCVKLKQHVFSKPEFKSWAAENVVLLELDYPKPNRQPDWLKRQNQQLSQRFQISQYPTVLLLTAEGQVIGKLGYREDARRWIATAQRAIDADRSLRTAEYVDTKDFKRR